MSVLYITTFNKKLYDMSGKNFIDTFLQYIKNGTLLICYEEFEFYHESDRIISYNIENDKYMNDWITKNKIRIPKMYGGEADEDAPFFGKTLETQYWANHRASRFFRKIVALHYGLLHYADKYDYIFVVDSDCIFKSNVTSNLINDLFKDNVAMTFFWGKHRRKINRGPETGFTGYSKKNNGFVFANVICDCYQNQDFLRFQYWDDGYVIGQLINENDSNFKFNDLAKHSNRRTTRVMEIENQPLFNIIHHFKNKHQTSV